MQLLVAFLGMLLPRKGLLQNAYIGLDLHITSLLHSDPAGVILQVGRQAGVDFASNYLPISMAPYGRSFKTGEDVHDCQSACFLWCSPWSLHGLITYSNVISTIGYLGQAHRQCPGPCI